MTNRTVSEFYDEPGMEWSLRNVGTHLHPGGEEATVVLATRAASFGFCQGGGAIVEVASALGAPARFVARRFACYVVCVDMDRRMHRSARQANTAEGLHRMVWPVLARTERLPLQDASMDGAWSQDALCHMDKPAVVGEVGRVLKPGAVFAFTDFVARDGITSEDLEALRRTWAFPSLFELDRYRETLRSAGMEVLLEEDRTADALAGRPQRRPDDDEWWSAFATRWGEHEATARMDAGRLWQALLQSGRAGYGLFVARKR